MVDVQRVDHLVFGDGDSSVRTQGVAHAQFVKRVAVVSGQISHNHVRHQQLLIHGNVDDSRMDDFVRPLALQTGRDGRGPDDSAVRFVEVQHAPGRVVGLLSEAHHNETRFCARHRWEHITTKSRDRPTIDASPNRFAILTNE